VDPARLGYKSQAIITEIYFTPARVESYKVGRKISTNYPDDQRMLTTAKSKSWMDATNSHINGRGMSHRQGCEWCAGFQQFRNHYPPGMGIRSVSSLQEQDTTWESMKK